MSESNNTMEVKLEQSAMKESKKRIEQVRSMAENYKDKLYTCVTFPYPVCNIY